MGIHARCSNIALSKTASSSADGAGVQGESLPQRQRAVQAPAVSLGATSGLSCYFRRESPARRSLACDGPALAIEPGDGATGVGFQNSVTLLTQPARCRLHTHWPRRWD